MVKVLDTDHVREQFARCASRATEILIAVPFVTRQGIEHVLGHLPHGPGTVNVRLLSRFDSESMLTGVCEPEALMELFGAAGPEAHLRVAVRRLQSLHAKTFVFDKRAAIVGSTNLTAAGLSVNDEMGIYCTEARLVAETTELFERFWDAARDVDRAWVQGQIAFLAPRRIAYHALKQQVDGLLTLPSLKMPSHECDFVASLRAIVQRVRRGGATRQWLDGQLQMAAERPDADGVRERHFRPDKRFAFLQLLCLLEVDSDRLSLGEFGREWCQRQTDVEPLCQRMATLFPILGDAYTEIAAVSETGGGWMRFRTLAGHLGHAGVKQELRDAVHWLRDLGLVNEVHEGLEIEFRLTRRGPRRERLARILAGSAANWRAAGPLADGNKPDVDAR